MNERAEFVKYVLDFYGVGGLYDFGADDYSSATAEDVEKALDIRLERHKDVWFDGDSFDRELVRDIMLEFRGEPRQGSPWAL